MEKFHSFSITHKGSKHGDDVPCQDASAHLDTDNPDTAAIAIVADGHGSSRCFRSDIGSNKAVEITKNCVAAFVEETPELPSEMTVQVIDRKEVEMSESKIALSNLVRAIIDKWFAAVMKDEKERPLKDDLRLEGIDKKYKDRYIDDDNADYRCHAYGTTLMVAVVTKDYWFGFQVGDGKCVALYEDGSWGLPIPWDDKCTFNTTTSICDDDSLSGFRYWFGFRNANGNYTEYGYGVLGQGKDYVREIESCPLAIFIGSDGVEDSYPRVDNDKYVINFYRNRIVNLAESDFGAFNEEISGLAKRFADRESTDDVSIAGIVADDLSKADISKMKHDSEVHEKIELASVKLRDAAEKKDAFAAVQKRTDAATANKRKLENKITTIKSEVADLNSRKMSFESTLAKAKSEVEISDREMSEMQSKIRELLGEKDKYTQDERLVSAKISIAVNELKKAEKEKEKREKDFSNSQDLLRKRKEAYDKYQYKFTTGKPQASIVGQLQNIAGSQAIFTTAVTYDADGNVTKQVIAQITPANSSTQASTLANGVVTDVKSEKLKQEIEITDDETRTFRTQAEAARQNVESKTRDIGTLNKQLYDAQQRTRQVETDINRAKQGCRTAEISNQKRREVVRQCQNNIVEIDRNIRSRQAEIDKLNDELETLKEQTKKQTETLETIKAAWEKAEAEAQALTEIIQNTR